MPIEGALALIFLVLALIFGALVVLIRKADTKTVVAVPGLELQEFIQELDRAARHHIQVSAVIKMVETIEHYPNAIELLKKYPETVRAAAWSHYINCLGLALQDAQGALQRAYRERYVSDPYLKSIEVKVAHIRAMLDNAIEASGQSFRPQAV